ncbi:OpgC family protein [Methylocella sp.]|uniref:OpgC family protein n=1 Tax=Methylocella sp. TaxID=1978226 RepID=UPI0035AF437F
MERIPAAPRAPNEIDFWRGFALITIFVNHVPGLVFERLTFRNLSLSDSAELFVFLAGVALRKLADGPVAPLSAPALAFRLEGRAFAVYVAQTLITEVAIAMLAAASIVYDAPFMLDWHNASAVFNQPVEAHIGLVLLTHQLGYFNILPLYVVLMFAAPVIALLHRAGGAALLLPLSLALYAYALVFGVNLPTWPVEGSWFFNPLSWQLIFCLGFCLSGPHGFGALDPARRRALRLAAAPVLVAGAFAALVHYSPNPRFVPEPKLLFMFDKTFLSPARILHALALYAAFAGLYGLAAASPAWKFLSAPAAYFSMLGRNSLNVFCAASILSLAGQIARFVYGGHVATDALIIILGAAIMGLVAWASEWRARLPAPSAARSRSP